MNIYDCTYYESCLNNSKCYLCGPEMRLLKVPEDRRRKTNANKAKQKVTTDVSWRSFEKEQTAKLNAVPTVKEYEAMRQVASGAIEGLKGDISDPVVLAECKEYEVINARGEKIISIDKHWLDKIFQEAKDASKYPALFYRYKGSEEVYIVQDERIWMDMVHEIKFLRTELQRKDQIIQELRKREPPE